VAKKFQFKSVPRKGSGYSFHVLGLKRPVGFPLLSLTRKAFSLDLLD
jgi:hypothetical protein